MTTMPGGRRRRRALPVWRELYTQEQMFGRYRQRVPNRDWPSPTPCPPFAEKGLMAGIGFELRKLLKRDSLLGVMQAYAYAGIISSGPWVLSIIGILIIGVMSCRWWCRNS
jgi:hypothetical protein